MYRYRYVHVQVCTIRMLALPLLPAALLCQCFPHIHHVWITTDQLVRFHKNEFDEMQCKANSAENPGSFYKYSALP